MRMFQEKTLLQQNMMNYFGISSYCEACGSPPDRKTGGGQFLVFSYKTEAKIRIMQKKILSISTTNTQYN